MPLRMRNCLDRRRCALAHCAHRPPIAQTRLIFASQSPAGTPNTVFYNSWAQKVNEQSKGSVRIEVRDGETLANFITAYDRVNDDVIQIGWIIHGLVGNRFPLSDVSSLPFIGDDNVACSVASWRLYKSGLLDAEYKDIVPIWFGCLTTTYLHWAKEPKSFDDLGGAKIPRQWQNSQPIDSTAWRQSGVADRRRNV